VKLVRIALLLLAMGALTPLIAIALSALSGSDHRWPDVLAQFTAPAFICALLLTLGLIALRMDRASLASLLVAALLLLAVLPQWAPGVSQPATGAPTVRLYSANLYYLNSDVAAIRRSIEAADADVVVLIELGREPAQRIDEILAGYPHRVVTGEMNQSTGPSRSVIASRLPLTEGPGFTPDVHAVTAIVQSPLGRLNVVGVHLTRPWPYQFQWGQIRQTMALATLVKGLEGPVIVAGDFNSVSSTRIGRQVQSEIGLKPAPGWPGTWPAQLPSVLGVTIDQVWRSPDLAFVSRKLGAPTGSDHRPVVTEITRAAR
jgi:endonuclease/exonuclease/phosphatase (EEP) superfamily protein YafD